MLQEGSLKMVNKDRNAKTTCNIREGLPLTIQDVRRQTEDATLVTAVSTIYLKLFIVMCTSVIYLYVDGDK